jgi:hypothetical protein
VLGGLSEHEAAAVRAHLEGCPECRAEAEALRPVGELLRRADPARLEPAPQPPAGLARQVFARIREERRAQRRQRYRLALAGAAAAAVLGGAALVVGVLVGSSGDPGSSEPEPIEFKATRGELEMSGFMVAQDWGSEIHVYARGVSPGSECHVYLRREGGGSLPAGSFRYQRDWSGPTPVLSSALAAEEVRAVVVHVGGRSAVAPLKGTGAPES